MAGQLFVVRAMTAPGHTRRFRAGRPWGSDPVTVKVVDSPSPTRIDRDRDGREIVTYADEISPVQLAALQADRFFAVAPLGDGDADATSVNALKVQIIELEKALAAEKLAHQGAIEDLKAHQSNSFKDAEESAARGMRLEQDLADAKGQLTEKRSKGK